MSFSNKFLPDEPILENDDFVIYGNNDLHKIKDELLME